MQRKLVLAFGVEEHGSLAVAGVQKQPVSLLKLHLRDENDTTIWCSLFVFVL